MAGCGDLLAQNEYRNWYFGEYAGIRFDADTVVPLRGSAMKSWRASAIISDRASGRVLFYTDGMTIWDSIGSVMQNGSSLHGHSDDAQGAVIVPMPCDTNRYYVFTNDGGGDNWNYRRGYLGLNYSIVDMRLNAGRGAVTTKNVNLLPHATERMAATLHGNGRDYWLIAQDRASYGLRAFHVMCGGISAPVTSPAADHLLDTSFRDRFGDVGQIQVSPDGTRLAITQQGSGGPPIPDFVDIYRFDAWTGRAYDSIHIPFPVYAPEFSPDGSKLYWLDVSNRGLFQIDITVHSVSAAATRTALISPFRTFGGLLQRGPDDRIYVTSRDDTMLTVIASPNLAGLDCDVRYRSISLGGRRPLFGLPNNIDSREFGLDRTCRLVGGFSVTADTICSGSEVAVLDRSTGSTDATWIFEGGEPRQWRGRQPPPIRFERGGSYALLQIAEMDRCHDIGYDTTVHYIEVLQSPTVDIGEDVVICSGQPDSVRLDAGASGSAIAYSWSPIEGLSCSDCPSPLALPSATTTYHVTVADARGCLARDSVTVWRTSNAIPLKLTATSGQLGDTLDIVVSAAGSAIAEPASVVTFTIETEPSSLLLAEDGLTVPRLVRATVLERWSIGSLKGDGRETVIEFRAPAGAPLRLRSGDTLLRIASLPLLGTSQPAVRVSAESPQYICNAFLQAETTVAVELCGYTLRGIELSRISASRPVASYRNGTIEVRFAIPWPDDVSVEFYDTRGVMYHRRERPSSTAGAHVVTLDARELPSGIYLVVVVLGESRFDVLVRIP